MLPISTRDATATMKIQNTSQNTFIRPNKTCGAATNFYSQKHRSTLSITDMALYGVLNKRFKEKSRAFMI